MLLFSSLLCQLHFISSLISHLSLSLFDQENIPVEEVLDKLKCTELGLSSDDVERRLQVFGYNKLEEKKVRTYVRSLNSSPLLVS